VIARSYLYVPGHRPERFSKALASGSDAVILDLEDAVPVAAKEEAVAAIAEFLHRAENPGPQIWVRINAGHRGLSDLDAVGGLARLSGVLVPKATATSLVEPIAAAGGKSVVALIESAIGLLQLADIASLAGVTQLALGEVDLAADLGMLPSADGRELDVARVNVVVASAASGLLPPIGPVWIDIPDGDGLAASTSYLRRLGFGSRQAIHPSQIDIINAALTPSVDELAQASHVLDLAARAGGAACVDEHGRMIDEAVLRSARRLLESPPRP
jgi:citrate lyase subunit beta/citryl-CoA lyase